MELERRGTVSAAAKALFITQSAASQRLREGERRLGFPLTERTGRRVALTTAAQRLVEAARVSERTLVAAEADARWLANSGVATLRLVQDVYDTLWWLAPMLDDMSEQPDLAAVELVRVLAGQGQTAVVEGRADALIAPSGSRRTASGWTLFDDDLVAIVPAESEFAGRDWLSAEDFVDATYVTYSTTPQDGFEYASFFAPANLRPKRILRMESVAVIVDLVAAGHWRSILPRWTVPPDRGVVAIPLDPAPAPISWSLHTRDLKGHPELLKMAEHLAATLSNMFGQNGPTPISSI